MFDALDRVYKEIFATKTAVDAEFPDWMKSREDDPTAYWNHDARREFFVTLLTALENARLSKILLERDLANPEWWQEHFDSLSEDKIQSSVREYGTMIRWFSFHLLAMSVEETLRSIDRAEPALFNVPGKGHKKFATIYERVLTKLSLEQHIDLFVLLSVTRNTLHTNGLFAPPNNKDRTITYDGDDFNFVCGRPLKWLDNQRVLWFYDKMSEIMNLIIRSDKVSGIVQCPHGPQCN